MPGNYGSKRTGKSPTIFGRIKAKNVTFLVDISGSMYRVLDDIKDQLIRAISDKSANDYDATFNLIAFSDDVYPWASSLMPCTPRTVSIASDWIRYVCFHLFIIYLPILITVLLNRGCSLLD